MDPNNHPTGHSALHNSYEDEISLFDLISILWKRKVIIILAVFLCTAITGAYLFISNKATLKTSTLFSLNFSGIETHNYPDGSTFQKSQVISPAILTKVEKLNNSNLKSTGNRKGYTLSIDGIVPPEIAAKLKKEPSETYLPNLFSLTLELSDDNLLSEAQRAEILLAIIEEYRNDFTANYINQQYFSEQFPDDFFQANDYSEIINILNIRIKSILQRLDLKAKSIGNYYSPVKNLSFSELQTSFQILKTVELNRISDVVDNLNLTRDKHLFEIKLREKLKRLELNRSKEDTRALIAEELLKTIMVNSRNDVQKTLAANAVTVSTPFIEKLRKEDNLSFLIKTILDAKTKGNAFLLEKNRIEEMLKNLAQNTSNADKNIPYIESGLKQIIQTYISLVKDLNIINREYLSIQYANSIKLENAPVSVIVRGKNAKVFLCLAGIASLFLSIILVFFIEYIKNETAMQQVPTETVETSQFENFNQKIEPMETANKNRNGEKRNAG